MRNISKLILSTILLSTASLALAHPGHQEVLTYSNTFASGVLHPLFGLDHLLAMAAIGIWSMGQNNTLKRATPFFMVGGMILGAILAVSGIGIPGVETGIAMSVLLAGLLIVTLAKLPTIVGGIIVTLFMVAHGHAHGTEMASGASLAVYMLGFVISTLLITYTGRAIGYLLQKSDNRITRAVGGVITVMGGIMVAG